MNQMATDTALPDISLDDADAGIIAQLRADGRAPYRGMAKELGLTEATVRSRIKKYREVRCHSESAGLRMRAS